MSSYAIVKHHFFDVRLVLIRTITFLFLILLLVLSYGYLLTVFASSLFEIKLSAGFVLINIFLAALTAVAFTPLYRCLANFTSNVFYKTQYDSDELLAILTHVMASTIDIDVMTKNLASILSSKLHVRQVDFMFPSGVKSRQEFAFTKNDREHLLQIFSNNTSKKSLVFRTLPEGVNKDLLRRYDLSLIIPIHINEDAPALLLLGQKRSGDIFTDQDIAFLELFASEAGIAIQNARSYREIQRFNEELEDIVDERTKQLKDAQTRELQKAQDVARLKDEFVFIATHELRAPVTAIRLFVELAGKHKDDIPKDMQKHFDSIVQASDHLNQLIDDVLEIARSESDATELHTTSVNLLDCVAQVTDELRAMIEQKNITIDLLNPLPSTMAMADSKKIKEVITNIISNAIKYNKENGSIIVTLVDLDAENIMVEVRDTGIGIPKEQQEKIFEKFYRASSPATEHITGTGLGMFITRMLVEKMGGTIEFSSVEDEGTTVAFSLPKSNVTN